MRRGLRPTVRELFREMRHAYRPPNAEEGQLALAIRGGDPVATIVWFAAAVDALAAARDGAHQWGLSPDGYRWVCRRCGADAPSLSILETEPSREAFSDDCGCRACRPCEGRRP